MQQLAILALFLMQSSSILRSYLLCFSYNLLVASSKILLYMGAYYVPGSCPAG